MLKRIAIAIECSNNRYVVQNRNKVLSALYMYISIIHLYTYRACQYIMYIMYNIIMYHNI